MSKDYNLESTPANSIRRSELACDDAWIKAFLTTAEVGHLATRWDEQPFITPLLFWYDAETHAIYFHAATAGRLHANSQRHPRLALKPAGLAACWRPTSPWNSPCSTRA